MRPREDFGSDLQFKKYLLAVEYAEKIKDFQDRGYLILEPEGNVLQGNMVIPDDDENAAVTVVLDGGGCTFGIICFSYGEDGIPWIEDTMKQIHLIFRGYSCINPKDIHKIFIKNSKYVKKFVKGEPLC